MALKQISVVLVKTAFLATIAISALLTTGCVPKVARPEMLTAPKPQPDAKLEYLSPYTSDGVMCEWTDKMANVSLAGKIGGTVAAVAAQQVLKNIPIAGAFLGMVADRAGEAVGRKIAIESVGGMEFIQSKSDQSFATVEELALHMYTTYCYNEHYNASLGAMMELYPELKRDGNRYNKILLDASGDICKNNPKCVPINELGNLCGTGVNVAKKTADEPLKQQTPPAAATSEKSPAAEKQEIAQPPATTATDTAPPADKTEKSAPEKNVTPAK